MEEKGEGEKTLRSLGGCLQLWNCKEKQLGSEGAAGQAGLKENDT